MKKRIRGVIYDLDGVIVNTAGFHTEAWTMLAEDLGIQMTHETALAQRGVDRMKSLELLLRMGNLRMISQEKKLELADRKNRYYIAKIRNLTQADLLEGAEEALRQSRQQGLKVALGSASRNAEMILDRLEIRHLFDYVVDPRGLRSKPSPDIFMAAANELDLTPSACLVFEDSVAGIHAAFAAGMQVVGIGSIRDFPNIHLDICIHALSYFDFEVMEPRK